MIHQALSPSTILLVIALYFLLLLFVSYLTGKSGDSDTFFKGNRQSPWLLVAIGMVGASLSGVTYISVPGAVGAGGANMAFSYMQMVFGYLLGYLFIAKVLLPIYYKMNVTSIYQYLENRLGLNAYKTGAAFFLISRIMGASFRLFLVSIVIQKFVLGPMGVPFVVTVAGTIILIWIYTMNGGIKTIVWTDTIQTVCMLLAVGLTINALLKGMGFELSDLTSVVQSSEYSQMFFFEDGWSDPNNFYKQFFGGALLTIAMTGLDQDMMQKNLTCKNIKDAQKNMFLFSGILVVANLLFLALGAILYVFAAKNGIAIPERADQLFPTIALEYLTPFIGIVFILGLIAAAYSSADSALTSLTTSYCVDFLNFENSKKTEAEKKRIRIMVHIGFSITLLIIIVWFNSMDNKSIINELFRISGYTYGPLLGLFGFGIFTKRKINDNYLVILICVLAPIISFFLTTYSEQLFNGFEFGFLTLALNGMLTFIGLYMISSKKTK